MAALKFNIDRVNLVTSSKSTSGLNYRKGPGTTYEIIGTAVSGKSWGRTTGNYYPMSDGNWWQVLLNSGNGYAWVREDVTKFSKPTTGSVSDSEGQKMIEELVTNDIKIHESLVRSANILNGAKQKGLNVTQYDSKYKALLDRHIKRQDKIKNSKLLKWQTGIRTGMEKLINGFKSWLQLQYGINISGIGAIPIVAVVISAVAGAGLAVTAYFAFRPEYDESKTDLKVSADLEKALNSLDPVTAQKVKDELEKQVDDAYNKGKTAGTFSGAFKLIKPVLFMGAGFWLITRFIDAQKQKN